MKSQPRSAMLAVYGVAAALVWLALEFGAARASALAARPRPAVDAVASR